MVTCRASAFEEVGTAHTGTGMALSKFREFRVSISSGLLLRLIDLIACARYRYRQKTL